jgi:hypothetical protein
MNLDILILLLHTLATWFMLGLIWFVQVVHYPLMARVAADHYPDYQRRHMTLTTWVVAPAMLIELLTAMTLLWVRPSAIPDAAVWVGLAAIALIWGATATLQVPQHERLAAAFSPSLHRRLVATNWLRTLAWSARAALVAWMCWRTLTHTP